MRTAGLLFAFVGAPILYLIGTWWTVDRPFRKKR